MACIFLCNGTLLCNAEPFAAAPVVPDCPATAQTSCAASADALAMLEAFRTAVNAHPDRYTNGCVGGRSVLFPFGKRFDAATCTSWTQCKRPRGRVRNMYKFVVAVGNEWYRLRFGVDTSPNVPAAFTGNFCIKAGSKPVQSPSGAPPSVPRSSPPSGAPPSVPRSSNPTPPPANTYFPYMYEDLVARYPPGPDWAGRAGDLPAIRKIYDTWVPLIYDPKRDTQSLVTYLTDPRSARNDLVQSRTYAPGTNSQTEYVKMMKVITQAPTKKFREVLMLLTRDPTPANAARYASIVNAWAGRSFYTNPISVPPDELQQGLALCVVAVSFMAFKDTSASASVAQRTRKWVADMLTTMETPPLPRHSNNIQMTSLIARAQARLAIGLPVIDIARAAVSWAAQKITSDGYMGESRQQLTVMYTHRCATMLLVLQCMMRRLDLPTLTGTSRDNLARTIAILAQVSERGGTVMPPTVFHARSGWKTGMQNIKALDVLRLRQMFAYAFGNAGIETLTSTEYIAGSFTLGDVAQVLRLIRQ